MRTVISMSCRVALVITVWIPQHRLVAQEGGEPLSRGPRFLLASADTKRPPVPIDVSRTPMLRKRLSVDLQNVPVKQALAVVTQQSGLALVYSDDLIPANARVTLRGEISLVAALTEILLDVNADVVFWRDGRASLARRSSAPLLAGTVTGRVTDATTKEPIAGVTVSLDGAQRRVVTAGDGAFRIANVSPGEHTLSARRLGYAPYSRRITVTDNEELPVAIELNRTATLLSQIVTTATGEQRRVELGHVVGVIEADSLVPTTPINNISDLIRGRVSSVQVLNGSGMAGGGTRIRVRGINSFTLNNDPIVIIDGVRMGGAAGDANKGDQSGTRSFPTPSRLDDIDPATIESMELVKGASAATLYGTDAANGVIVIKTKRGAASTRARWASNLMYGYTEKAPFNFPEPYRSWGRLLSNNAQTACRLVDVAARTCVVDSLTHFNPFNVDGLTPLADGSQQSTGLQVSGGGASVQYFLAGSFNRAVGPLRMPAADEALILKVRGSPAPDWQIRPNFLQKETGTARVTAQLGGKVDVSASMNLIHQYQRSPQDGGTTSLNLVGAGTEGPGYRDGNDGWVLFTQRPGGGSFSRVTDQFINRLITGSTLNWRPTESITARLTGGLDFNNRRDGLTLRPGDNSGSAFPNDGGSATTTGTHNTYRGNEVIASGDAAVTFRHQLRPWLMSATAFGSQYKRSNLQALSAEASGLALGVAVVNGATTVTTTERSDADAVLGAYVDQTFGMNDELFLNLAMRVDGSSNFGERARFTRYPKAGLSWIATRSRFVQAMPFVSTLRLRAAYGRQGLQPRSIDALQLYSAQTSIVNGASVPSLTLLAAGNPNLRPERVTEHEGGIDLGLFADRVTVELTGYNKRSDDAIVAVSVAPDIGLPTGTEASTLVPLASRRINVGAVRNRGFEMAVGARVMTRTSLTWDASLTGSVTGNKLVTLTAPIITSSGIRQVQGYPLFGRWARPILGYKDVNGDGIITASEIQIGDSSVYLGPGNPTRDYAVNNSFGFAGGKLRLSTQLDYQGGFKQYNAMYFRQCLFLLCRGLNDPTASLADQAASAATIASPSSDIIAYSNGAAWVFRELSLTYVLPPALTRFLQSPNASASLMGRNLHMWTKYVGVDPQANGNYGGNSNSNRSGSDSNADVGALPQARYWMLRVNLLF